MKFCSQCGASVTYRLAPDEDRERHVCDACDTVHYINPKVIVGCLPTVGEKILMCKTTNLVSVRNRSRARYLVSRRFLGTN